MEDVKSRVDATGVTWESQKAVITKLNHLTQERNVLVNCQTLL